MSMSPRQMREFVSQHKATIQKASSVAWDKVDTALKYTEGVYDELRDLRKRVAELESVDPDAAAAAEIARLKTELVNLRANLRACVTSIDLKLEDER